MSRNQDRKKATPRVGDGSQIVTIHIPAEGGVVTMHAHLAAHFSDYFRAALDSPMEEARTLSFALGEPATVDTVAGFAGWAYAAASRKGGIGAYVRDELGIDTVDKVVDAWLLADYLGAARYGDLLVVLLCRLLRDDDDATPPSPPRHLEMAPLLARLPEGCGPWRLLIAFLAKRLSDPAAGHGNGGPAAAAGGNGLNDYALEELNRALITQLMAARSCLIKLGDMVPVGPSMQRELKGVLVNGVLDARRYLEADGSR